MSQAQKKRGKSDIRPFSVRTAGRSSADESVIDLHPGWAVAIFAAVTLAFFWGHLFGGAFLWEDFAEFTYPNEVFAARNFIDGVIPHWNPYTFSGMPFVADLQIGYFYPPNLLMYLLSGGELSSTLAQAFVVLHYFIAMLGMWALARGFGLGSWGSVFAGITYGLSGILVAHMIHPNLVHHLAWFPLVVHLFHLAVRDRSWLHSILAGIVLGMAMLSGHPQSALFIVFFLFCFTIFLLVRDARSGTERAATSGLLAAAAAALLPVVIGVGIFAIQLLPAQELAGLSERAEATYEKSLEGKMGPAQVFTLVVPKFFGVSQAEPVQDMPFWYSSEGTGPQAWVYWETAIYIGVVALLLLVLGVASTRLGPLRWFLAGMALLGVLYGLGNHFFVHPILGRLPLFETFRSPARMAMFLSLGGAVLAGAGLDVVLRRENGKLLKAALITSGVIVAVGLLALSGVLGSMVGAPEQVADAISRTGLIPLLIGGLAGVVVWAAMTRRMPGAGAAVALLLLALIDLFSFGVGQNTSGNDPQQIYEHFDQKYANFKVDPPGNIARLRMRDETGMLMQRNQGPYSRILLFEGYNPLLLERRVPPAATPEKAFDLMNVRYTRQGGSDVPVERPSAYEHARMMYDARVVSTEESLRLLKSGEVDFGKTVLLEKDPGIALDGSGEGTAQITRYEADEIAVDVTTSKPGILLLSEVWYPAWKAYIDDKPAEILIADYSLRGIAVPEGQHTVVLRYESSAFGTGVWITIITSLLAVAGAVFLVVTGRRSDGQTVGRADGLNEVPVVQK